jgi:ABC-type amino acid transport substrate-binding protein
MVLECHSTNGGLRRSNLPVPFPPKQWLRVRIATTEPAQAPNFLDVMALVAIPVVLLFGGSIFYYSSLSTQVTNAADQVRSLREQLATLQEQLGDAIAANQLDTEEISVPHPTIQDRDSQTVGDHTNVSWTYPNEYSGRYVNFELELVTLSGGPNCFQQSTSHGCEHSVRFITSDAINHTSRIPTDLTGTLPPGTYAWRVVPVPAGTVVNDDRRKDDLSRLSNWSNFGAFTIYPSLTARVADTHIVRVGTNLEQDTRFSRRRQDGSIIGLDISLIYTLVERCLDISQGSITFDQSKCRQYIGTASSRDKLSSPPDSCPKDSQLCVKLIPIQKWGDWQAALRRKEIDLFIGAATAASYRETGGIRFTPGYLHYESRLYGHAPDVFAAHSDLRSWLSTVREIGVIEHSTNEYLLDHLKEDPVLRSWGVAKRIHGHSFPSFPAMEHAMDRGEVDGVLIDETFVDHDDWKPLNGVQTTQAWKEYLKDYLGTPGGERVAIAVAVDQQQTPRQESGNLYSALHEALAPASPVTLEYLPGLCKAFWEGPPANYSCQTNTGQ